MSVYLNSVSSRRQVRTDSSSELDFTVVAAVVVVVVVVVCLCLIFNNLFYLAFIHTISVKRAFDMVRLIYYLFIFGLKGHLIYIILLCI